MKHETNTPTVLTVTTTEPNRRDFLRRSLQLATGAALMSTSIVPGLRSGAWAAGSDKPEKEEVQIGRAHV